MQRLQVPAGPGARRTSGQRHRVLLWQRLGQTSLRPRPSQKGQKARPKAKRPGQGLAKALAKDCGREGSKGPSRNRVGRRARSLVVLLGAGVAVM